MKNFVYSSQNQLFLQALPLIMFYLLLKNLAVELVKILESAAILNFYVKVIVGTILLMLTEL